MAMLTDERVISADEFWELVQLPEYDDLLLELVEGEITEVPKPGGIHGEIAGNIFGLIWTYARENKLGRTTAAETGFILGKKSNGRDTVRGLDVAFIRMERAPQPLDAGFVPIAPDLAVEVISPNNTASDIHNKTLELLQAGTTLIWIVYPESQTVVVHTKAGAKTLTINDTLDGGAVLPGFQLPVKDIFNV